MAQYHECWVKIGAKVLKEIKINTYKIYAHKNEGKGSKQENRLCTALWSHLNSNLLVDEQLKRFEKIGAKTGTLDINQVIDSIRLSFGMKSKVSIRRPNQISARIEINTRKLKNNLLDRFDNNVISKARRRTSFQDPAIPFVDEICNYRENILFTFVFDYEKQKISEFKILNNDWKHRKTWLEGLIFKSVNELENSIFYEGQNDERENQEHE